MRRARRRGGLSEEDLLLWAQFPEAAGRLAGAPALAAGRGRGRPGQPTIDRELLETLVDVVEAAGEAEVSVEVGGARVTVRRAGRRRRRGRGDGRRRRRRPGRRGAGAGGEPDGGHLLPRARARRRTRSCRRASAWRPAQTLCLIEAMKLFNEILAEHAGIVRHIRARERRAGGVRPAALPDRAVKLLVANRGEIAVRVRAGGARDGDPDGRGLLDGRRRDAWRCDLADEAVCIGPPPARDSYLNIRNVLGAAEITGCDAVHPGYGFLSENAGLRRAPAPSRASPSSGPTPEVMERMGDKVAGQGRRPRGRPAGAAGLGRPGAPTCRRGPAAADARRLPDPAEGRRRRRRAGHAPGGAPAEDLAAAFEVARREAEAAFGDGGLYVERAAGGRPPRRDPGDGRRPRRRAGLRRPRVLDPAPPPEAGRGGAGAATCPHATRERHAGGRPARRARRGATAAPARWSSWSTPPATSSSWS